jgi:hypothetical protein
LGHDRSSRCDGIIRGYELSSVVETALARALVLAAQARRWDVVTQIAEELHGRRVGTLTALHVTKVSG